MLNSDFALSNEMNELSMQLANARANFLRLALEDISLPTNKIPKIPELPLNINFWYNDDCQDSIVSGSIPNLDASTSAITLC